MEDIDLKFVPVQMREISNLRKLKVSKKTVPPRKSSHKKIPCHIRY